jgi:leader peptidase (prepilin peptidase)/N-methyltransferase
MILGAATLWALLWALARFSRGGVGRGDLRLAPCIGAAMGFVSIDALLTGIVGMSLVGAAWAVAKLVRQGRGALVPFVPSMYVGLLIAVVAHG